MGKTLSALTTDTGSEEVAAEEAVSEVLTEDKSVGTVETASGTRVHMDRAIGGRYVSLGGGERVWVPEEGQEISEDDPRKIDDAEIP